jgi:putative ABC transport system permease protein
VVNVLDLKMLRDLWSMRTQVVSIALLIAAGIAVLVMSVSNCLALVRAMDAHYRNERFGEVFATLKRAPLSLVERIRQIDGIGVVEPRISQAVRVIRPDSELPISGRILSLPPSGQPMLNRLHLVEGGCPTLRVQRRSSSMLPMRRPARFGPVTRPRSYSMGVSRPSEL